MSDLQELIDSKIRQALDRVKGGAAPTGFGGSDRLATAAQKVGRETRPEPTEVKLYSPSEKLTDFLPRGEEEAGEPLSMAKCLRGIVTGNWADARTAKFMSENSGSAGGFLVPDTLSREIIDIARNRAACVQAGARTVEMPTPTMTIARITQDVAAGWRGEHSPLNLTELGFGALVLSAKTLGCVATASVELFEDAQDIDKTIERALGESLAVSLDHACLYADGTEDAPLGLTHWEGLQKIDKAGAAISNYDDFSLAVQKVLEANGPEQGLAAVMGPRTWGEVDRLKDKQDQPLQAPRSWQNLKKLVTNQVPANLGSPATKTEVAVGDFSQLLIGVRTRLQVEATRVAGDSFRKMQVMIRAYLRADVAVARPSWFTLVTNIGPVTS